MSKYDHDYDDCNIHNCDCWEEKIEKLQTANDYLRNDLRLMNQDLKESYNKGADLYQENEFLKASIANNDKYIEVLNHVEHSFDRDTWVRILTTYKKKG